MLRNNCLAGFLSKSPGFIGWSDGSCNFLDGKQCKLCNVSLGE